MWGAGLGSVGCCRCYRAARGDMGWALLTVGPAWLPKAPCLTIKVPSCGGLGQAPPCQDP